MAQKKLDPEHFVVMLRHLREHLWCLLARQDQEDTPDVRDDLAEVHFLLDTYDGEL